MPGNFHGSALHANNLGVEAPDSGRGRRVSSAARHDGLEFKSMSTKTADSPSNDSLKG